MVHISGWLYLLVANAYAMNQDLLNGTSYFPLDFMYYFIFYLYPIVFFFLVITIQGRTDRELSKLNSKGDNSTDNYLNCCFMFVYAFGAPCYVFFTPYALY